MAHVGALATLPRRVRFFQPIIETTNGVTVFEGVVEKDVHVVLKLAALDRDRTMLFAAELEVTVSGLSE